jgi:hypothetical protein
MSRIPNTGWIYTRCCGCRWRKFRFWTFRWACRLSLLQMLIGSKKGGRTTKKYSDRSYTLISFLAAYWPEWISFSLDKTFKVREFILLSRRPVSFRAIICLACVLCTNPILLLLHILPACLFVKRLSAVRIFGHCFIHWVSNSRNYNGGRSTDWQGII